VVELLKQDYSTMVTKHLIKFTTFAFIAYFTTIMAKIMVLLRITFDQVLMLQLVPSLEMELETY
jgi:hypothetical protein